MASDQLTDSKTEVQKSAVHMEGSITVRKRLRHLVPKGGFVANVLTLTTGSVLAQAIGVLATPAITRLYTPEHFGAFALFNSVTAFSSNGAGGKEPWMGWLPVDEIEMSEGA